jgi:hypothetical protein
MFASEEATAIAPIRAGRLIVEDRSSPDRIPELPARAAGRKPPRCEQQERRRHRVRSPRIFSSRRIAKSSGLGSHFAFLLAATAARLFFCTARAQPFHVLPENHTPEFALRIYIRALPAPGEFDEFSLMHFRAGQVYTVPSHLALLLIIGGYAELVDGDPARADAADFGQPRFPKRN